MNIRYIREWNDGNTDNEHLAHWIEIQAFSNGINVAHNKQVSANFFPNQDVSGQSNIDICVNGDIALNNYISVSLDLQRERPALIMIDLEQVLPIDSIQIWHGYWNENRAYFTILEVSVDGKKWTRLYDYRHNKPNLESIYGTVYNLQDDLTK